MQILKKETIKPLSFFHKDVDVYNHFPFYSRKLIGFLNEKLILGITILFHVTWYKFSHTKSRIQSLLNQLQNSQDNVHVQNCS